MKSFIVIAAVAFCAPAFANLTFADHRTGHVAGELAAAANTSFNGNMNVALSTLTPTALVHRAFLYASDWGSSGALQATFAGNVLVPASPFVNDNNLFAYRWDVTGLVQIAGNGSHAVSIQGAVQLFGCALAVVFEDPSLPLGEVELLDGAIALGDAGLFETGSAQFANFGAGSGTLSVYTQGDDASATGETVDFNGTTVHTGLDANLGATASLVSTGVTVLNGNNLTTLSTSVPTAATPVDVYGWNVAMLQGPQPVPEPFGAVALAIGAVRLLVRRRHT